MQVKRVKRYPDPRYPTQDYLREHPELLRYVPQRWRSNQLVLSVLSMVVPLILGCQSSGGESRANGAEVVRVAPLFIHGDGRGSFGCIVVNPPVFFSEDEARQIIQDEVKKAGIEFVPDGITFKNVDVPVTDPFNFDRKARKKTHKVDLVMDGYNEQHKVAFEIVTREDFDKWQRKDQDGWCSVSDFDLKETAERLAKGIAKGTAKSPGETYIGVFYEPGASAPNAFSPPSGKMKIDGKTIWELREEAAKEVGEKELREQVRDFLQWLKAQGVI